MTRRRVDLLEHCRSRSGAKNPLLSILNRERMALRKVLSSKPQTPYFKPPAIHICVVALKDQHRVTRWDFQDGRAVAAVTKANAVMAISDGHSVAKVTLYEDLKAQVQEGASYVVRGYNLRGNSPPYAFNVSRETEFFRSSALVIDEKLQNEALRLINPRSPLTPLSTCRESAGLVTVEGEVVEVSELKEVVVARDRVPLQNITLKQGETKVPVSLWRETALHCCEIGNVLRVSHLRGSESNYGFRLQTTVESAIEAVSSTAAEEVGVYGATPARGAPGSLKVLLEDDRTLFIEESKWLPIAAIMEAPPLPVKITVKGNTIVAIEAMRKEE
ncbi:uncharacterized protein LOC119199511 isoform X2 [Pungitius pungitius]|uniref:uncharacterized protein LOC119208972 isoform X2 n=2 Tax=Pungitius pungitius TaxID=134920 RepID=UPI001886F2CE|nr:uncharacterized protein LOC119208972 isoform X2 [Pungitius pungitius]XP_037313734.1 uncharacterized protein LOC119208976 isoform X2 [Pungitius pungitius]XP_037313737.1 uncharacterized protein LOC119208977 isoform X2 [Pungitius pungitius]XP_037313739.1 uncharacterized protein LOC119208978 isoform X2 [Pungitius pungitius]XP_037313743.1 uncharacterized protein LOC119208980 isoform X2 [Pungitius pungitius]XP_037335082.1 uncharacterized protein LOC119222477 isoform X2 [Pungitius pungitius]